jgi:integrase
MLNDTTIKNAKPREKPFKLFDERGLYLLVTPNGSKGWRFRYSHSGREKLLSLGLYPDVPLKRAREKRDEFRKLVADGTDPSARRQSEKHARAETFEAIAREWLEREEKVRSEKAEKAGRAPSDTIELLLARLERYIFPRVGSLPIKTIAAPELLQSLRRIEARGRHETARRVRAGCSRIFRYAIATGRAERDVAADLRGALVTVEPQNFAAITEPRRIGELLRAIDTYQGQPPVMFALKLAPLLFVRPGELRAAEWSEFDLEATIQVGKQTKPAAEWRIRAERTKAGERHVVPLSMQATALLRELHTHTGTGRYLFPSLRSPKRCMSDNTLNAALRRLGFAKNEMTTHGFRAMASTRLNEMGYPPDVIERQLAHAERNKVRAAYNRAERLEERRSMMQAWADYLDALRRGDTNVTAIRQRRQR